SRAVARPARPLSGPRSAQAAHRATSAAGALAVAIDAGLRRTLDRTCAPRRADRASFVRRAAQGVPPPAGDAVGAQPLARISHTTNCLGRTKFVLMVARRWPRGIVAPMALG